MQFQVPQFIDVEDKIVGPLSLRQFLYIAGAAGGVFLLYLLIPVIWLWFFLSLVVVGVGILMAFVKINGQPFTKVALSAIGFYWQPQTYLWQPDAPDLPKNEETLRPYSSGFSLESVITGLAIKSAWQQVQTGSHASGETAGRLMRKMKEQYEVIGRITGERRAAKRVDYR